MEEVEEKAALFVFPNQEQLDRFLGWFADGGGEYEYLDNQARDGIAQFAYLQVGPDTHTPVTEELAKILTNVQIKMIIHASLD